ncbi:MAG: CAF17-like 4Fe-4S cluster assembly/insertion protein YgfZ [Gammaproteobacteria bacterium]
MPPVSDFVTAWNLALGRAADNTSFAALADTTTDARQLGAGPCKFPQPKLGVIELAGADATDFLHAQVSADCRALPAGASVLTAWCSPKGRVLFLLRAVRARDGWFLLLPRRQVEPCAKRLRMFVLRADVSVTERSDAMTVIRTTAVDAPVPGAASGAEGDRSWHVVPLDALTAAWSGIDAAGLGTNAAKLEDIRRGVPLLADPLNDTFLPQELNLDLGGGVSFEKGCYPGQEIIARVKFRGQVKRRLAAFRAAGAREPDAGCRLVDATGRHVGTVISAGPADEQHIELLAVLDRDAEATCLDGQADVGLEPLSPDLGSRD